MRWFSHSNRQYVDYKHDDTRERQFDNGRTAGTINVPDFDENEIKSTHASSQRDQVMYVPKNIERKVDDIKNRNQCVKDQSKREIISSK